MPDNHLTNRTISNVAELVDVAKHSQMTFGNDRPGVWYRGVTSAKHKLVPGAMRGMSGGRRFACACGSMRGARAACTHTCAE